jgi:hypothetical protein
MSHHLNARHLSPLKNSSKNGAPRGGQVARGFLYIGVQTWGGKAGGREEAWRTGAVKHHGDDHCVLVRQARHAARGSGGAGALETEPVGVRACLVAS